MIRVLPPCKTKISIKTSSNSKNHQYFIAFPESVLSLPFSLRYHFLRVFFFHWEYMGSNGYISFSESHINQYTSTIPFTHDQIYIYIFSFMPKDYIFFHFPKVFKLIPMKCIIQSTHWISLDVNTAEEFFCDIAVAFEHL